MTMSNAARLRQGARHARAFSGCRGGPPAALLTVLLTVLVTACSAADALESVTEYRPDAAIERLQAERIAGLEPGLVRDFDIAGDTLYLLDQLGRVLVLLRANEDWRLEREIGRPGAGPGEFRNPSGIAAVPGGVVVAEMTRLQFLTADGSVTSTRSLRLPCPMMLPGIAAARTGLFVHGNCLRAGYATDTMSAVLAWSPDTAVFRTVAEDLRFTRDGSAGSIFGATGALTTADDFIHTFGAGTSNCVWLVDDTGAEPAAERMCPAAATLYRADPPPELEARLRSGTVGGMRVAWPPTLPPYVERIRAGGAIVLVRPFAADSVVLQLAAPDSRDLAVAPLDGLVGCRSGGCLWLIEDQDPPRIILLDAERLRALAGSTTAKGIANAGRQ